MVEIRGEEITGGLVKLQEVYRDIRKFTETSGDLQKLLKVYRNFKKSTETSGSLLTLQDILQLVQEDVGVSGLEYESRPESDSSLATPSCVHTQHPQLGQYLIPPCR